MKLPRERVTELVENGQGDPFAPAGKVFREWVAIPTVDRSLWQTLLAEAVDFARAGLHDSRVARPEVRPGVATRKSSATGACTWMSPDTITGTNYSRTRREGECLHDR